MYFSSIATSMLLATAVSASPLLEQRKAHPEVIPGPGLPSLASLGLTTAQLYETPVPGDILSLIIVILKKSRITLPTFLSLNINYY
ncbi:hypothetical protein HBI23_198150 [Parastagonospora nodorum]|nr:hypothetical protein HBI23_198150 [Parastagonospora nodorum]